MAQTNLSEKVKNLERDIAEIKKYLGLSILKKDLDLKNWGKLKKISRKIRKELFKEKYPKLYANIKKKE